MEFAKLERQRAVDAVYEALRRAIVGSDIKPGERLNVDELAEKLGVSLTPVRGAIQQLAAEGLVEIKPRSGTFVACLTSRDVEETFKIRCALECLAVEDAGERMSPQDLQRLRELLPQLAHPIESESDRRAHEQANFEFHQILVSASRNRRLLEMYEELNAHIKIARIHAADRNWGSRLQEEQAEHETIVSAMERHDIDAARAALRKHIYRAKDALLATLEQRDREA